MAAADDDDVKAVQVFIHGVIAQARAGTEVSPARPSWPRRETRLTPSLAFAHADTPACPAWPPPMTMTSKWLRSGMIQTRLRRARILRPKRSDRKSTSLNPVTNAQLVCRLLLEKKKNTTSSHH